MSGTMALRRDACRSQDDCLPDYSGKHIQNLEDQGLRLCQADLTHERIMSTNFGETLCGTTTGRLLEEAQAALCHAPTTLGPLPLEGYRFTWETERERYFEDDQDGLHWKTVSFTTEITGQYRVAAKHAASAKS